MSMHIAIVNTIIREKNDLSNYKVGEMTFVERLIGAFKIAKIDKVCLVIEAGAYNQYEDIIKKNDIDYIICKSENADSEILKYCENEETIIFCNSNIFIEKVEVVNDLIESFEVSNEECFSVFNEGFECIRVFKCKNPIPKTCFKINVDKIYKIADLTKCFKISKSIQNEICLRHINNGVEILDINSTYISEFVVIEKGVRIFPNCYIYGKTYIKANSIIYPNTLIGDTYVGKGCEIGPFSNLKKGTYVGDNCTIGAFVEVKNSVINRNVKAKHHAYLGDVDVGDNCNIGCGVIFANYDGKRKHRSSVGKGSFVGSNVTIVSPVSVGENAFLAAGSTIVEDVSANCLAIARNRQINKKDYYKT